MLWSGGRKGIQSCSSRQQGAWHDKGRGHGVSPWIWAGVTCTLTPEAKFTQAGKATSWPARLHLPV